VIPTEFEFQDIIKAVSPQTLSKVELI